MIQNDEPIELEQFRDGVMKLIQKLNSFNLNGKIKLFRNRVTYNSQCLLDLKIL
jgi:hypothetical protein